MRQQESEALLQELEADLQAAPKKRVLYLEGKSDPRLFFALLGVEKPLDDVHEGVLVKGLSARYGSGGKEVTKRVELATQEHHLVGCDVAQMFRAEATQLEETLRRSLEEAHALLNGKWLLEHFVTPQRKREEVIQGWVSSSIEHSGLPEVKALWDRIKS